MGANSSKSSEGSKNSPSVEDLKGAGSGSNGVLEDVRKQPIHRGPIQCVCAVGENGVASAGADQVRYSVVVPRVVRYSYLELVVLVQHFHCYQLLHT